MTEMVDTLINQTWTIKLPKHRFDRGEWWDRWEKERLASMHANTQQGDVVYYIGAEEGDMAALCAQWGAKLVMFEPDPLVWPNIKAIWEANKLDPPLACFVGFAANEIGAANLTVNAFPSEADGEIISDHGFANLSERPDIPRTKLDHLAFLNKAVTLIEVDPIPMPDIISMDVEGSELEVVKGALRILQEKRPLVYISVHPQFMIDLYSQTEDELWEFMDQMNYDRELLAHVHEDHWLCRPK